jgi:hypothetical protein
MLDLNRCRAELGTGHRQFALQRGNLILGREVDLFHPTILAGGCAQYK